MEKSTIKKIVLLVFVVILGIFFMVGSKLLSDFQGPPEYHQKRWHTNYISTNININSFNNVVCGYEIDIDMRDYISHENEIETFKNRLSMVAKEKFDREVEFISQNFDPAQIDEIISFSSPVWKSTSNLRYEIVFANFDLFNRCFEKAKFDRANKIFIQYFNFEISKDFFDADYNSQILNKIYKCASGMSFENSFVKNFKPNFYFDFSSRVRRTSSNAGNFYFENNVYHHVWQLCEGKAQNDFKATLKYIQSGWWYLLGVALPLAIMLVSIIAVLITGGIIKLIKKKKAKSIKMKS